MVFQDTIKTGCRVDFFTESIPCRFYANHEISEQIIDEMCHRLMEKLTLMENRYPSSMKLFDRIHPDFLQRLLDTLYFPKKMEYFLIIYNRFRGYHRIDWIGNVILKIEDIPSIWAIVDFLRQQTVCDFGFEKLFLLAFQVGEVMGYCFLDIRNKFILVNQMFRFHEHPLQRIHQLLYEISLPNQIEHLD